jgi:hypothetical protein
VNARDKLCVTARADLLGRARRIVLEDVEAVRP